MLPDPVYDYPSNFHSFPSSSFPNHLYVSTTTTSVLLFPFWASYLSKGIFVFFDSLKLIPSPLASKISIVVAGNAGIYASEVQKCRDILSEYYSFDFTFFSVERVSANHN